MTYRGIHLDLDERKDNKRDKWKKEMETKECLQSGEDITAERKYLKKRERMLDRRKNKNERKKKENKDKRKKERDVGHS